MALLRTHDTGIALSQTPETRKTIALIKTFITFAATGHAIYDARISQLDALTDQCIQLNPGVPHGQ
jgi:hypothetical protein